MAPLGIVNDFRELDELPEKADRARRVAHPPGLSGHARRRGRRRWVASGGRRVRSVGRPATATRPAGSAPRADFRAKPMLGRRSPLSRRTSGAVAGSTRRGDLFSSTKSAACGSTRTRRSAPRRELGTSRSSAVHINPGDGERSIGTVTRSDVRRLVEQWSVELAPRTIRRMFGVLRGRLRVRVFDDEVVVVQALCRYVKLPAVQELRRPQVSVERGDSARFWLWATTCSWRTSAPCWGCDLANARCSCVSAGSTLMRGHAHGRRAAHPR